MLTSRGDGLTPSPSRTCRGTTVILVLIIILFMVALAVGFLKGMGLNRDLAEGLRRNAVFEHTIFSGKWHAIRELEYNYVNERALNLPTTLGGHWEATFAPIGTPGTEEYNENNARYLWEWDMGLSSRSPDSDYHLHQMDGVWHPVQYFDKKYQPIGSVNPVPDPAPDEARYLARYAIAVMDLSGRLPINRGIAQFNADGVPIWRAADEGIVNATTAGRMIDETGNLQEHEPEMSPLQFTGYYMAKGLGFYEGYGVSYTRNRDLGNPNRLSDSDIKAGWLSKGATNRRLSQRYDDLANWPGDHTYDVFNWSLIQRIAKQADVQGAELVGSYGLSPAPDWETVASLFTPYGQGEQFLPDLIADVGDMPAAQKSELDKYQWMVNINTAPPAVIMGLITGVDAMLELEGNHKIDGKLNHQSFLYWYDKDPTDANAIADAIAQGFTDPSDPLNWPYTRRVHRTNPDSSDIDQPGVRWLTNQIVNGRPYTTNAWVSTVRANVGESGAEGIVTRLLKGACGAKLVRRQSRFYRIALQAQIWDRLNEEPLQQKTIDFVLHIDPNDNGKPGDSYIMYHVDRGWIQ